MSARTDGFILTVVAAMITAGFAALILSPQTADTPTPTQTVTVTAPPTTVKVTVPGPVRTVTVTRASRSKVRIPPRMGSPVGGVDSRRFLDLRRAYLWDEIAKCESGQRWNLNKGRFDGGLQFLPSTWRAWGGTRFAPYAWQATRAEQITIANRGSSGGAWLQPWPVCGKRAAAKFGMEFP